MTLKSNKNEPAVILESVNSVRTALSDLYLEQLLQNKPKSEKVGVLFTFIYLFFSLPPIFWCTACLLPGSRDGTHDRCLFHEQISKNRRSCLFITQLTGAGCVDVLMC